jgi:hypothetical protein
MPQLGLPPRGTKDNGFIRVRYQDWLCLSGERIFHFKVLIGICIALFFEAGNCYFKVYCAPPAFCGEFFEIKNEEKARFMAIF